MSRENACQYCFEEFPSFVGLSEHDCKVIPPPTDRRSKTRETKHTAEPWFFGSVITAADHVGIAQIMDNPKWPNGEVEANAQRIVACVNACEGIADPSVVPEMLEALRAVHNSLFLHSEYPKVCEQVDAAIARVEGRK